MSWIQTFTGKKFDYQRISLKDIGIEDIAHSLSMQCRFAGHIRKFYSIAEHCVHISRYASDDAKLWGLMHDSPEAYLTDIPDPLKLLLPHYLKLEKVIEKAILDRFDMYFDPFTQYIKDEIALLDKRILFTEKNQLFVNPISWEYEIEQLPLVLPCWEPEKAKYEFLKQFYKLIN